MNENPARFAPCRTAKTIPYVSLETISEFSGMDARMTEHWLENEIVTQQIAPNQAKDIPHVCGDVRYLPAHLIAQWLVDGVQTKGEIEQQMDAEAIPVLRILTHLMSASCAAMAATGPATLTVALAVSGQDRWLTAATAGGTLLATAGAYIAVRLIATAVTELAERAYSAGKSTHDKGER